MDRSQFYDILQEPEKAVDQLNALAGVVDQYPWFSHGQVLYAKALYTAEDPRQEDQLLSASVYASDRELLFDLIRSKPEDIETEVEENTSTETTEENKIVLESAEELRESLPVIEESAEAEKETSREELSEVAEENIGHEEVEVEIAQEEAKEEIQQEEISEEQSENSGLSIQEVFDSKEVENKEGDHEKTSKEEVEEESAEQDEEENRETRNPQLEKQILAGAVSRVIEKEVDDTHFELAGTIKTKEDGEKEEAIIADKSNEPTAYSSYTQWLLQRANQLKYKVEISSEIAEKKANSEETLDFKLDIEEKKKLDKKSKENLLDAFIAKDPKITPGKVKEYDVVDRSATSLTERDEFLTETMAMIYAQQGKIAKAKKAYKKLSLIYPEKSIYFAARIKELDKK